MVNTSLCYTWSYGVKVGKIESEVFVSLLYWDWISICSSDNFTAMGALEGR